MATAEQYADWIVKNQDKRGTPEFDTVASAYKLARGAAQPTTEAKPQKGFGQKLDEAIGDVPRQVGLTARHGIEGIGEILDFASSPIRAGLNAVLPKGAQIPSGAGQYLADVAGLPKPANGTERAVGDATRMMAGGAVPISVASKVSKAASGTTKAVADVVGSNPFMQTVSAGAAGGAGGYTRETGGGDLSQFVASVAAGVAAPAAVSKVAGAARGVQQTVNRLTTPPSSQIGQIDVQINHALRPTGMTMADLPQNIQNSIRSDVQAALKTNGTLSPAAVARLADYRITGASPNVATLTLDPAIVTQTKNLAKMGANSKDKAAQTLAQIENENNRQLITGLNELGASGARGEFAAGQNLVNILDGYATANKRNISSLYEAAKDSQGRAASLDPSFFSNTANDLLDQNLKGAFVPDNIRSMLNDFANGKVPLNINTAEQFKTIIGSAQRGAADGNVRAALGHIREALDNTPLLNDAITPATVNGGFQLKPVGGVSRDARANLGQDAIDAFNAARGANRSFMQEVESNPALAAVMNDVAPDQFFKKFVLNGPARDLESLLNVVDRVPSAKNGIKAEVAGYLKSQALSGAKDEVGNFSQSGFNKAMRSIGDQKLELIFSKEEINQLRAIGRVASYEQFQPKGSAVNNSNTAGTALANILDRFAQSPMLSKVPLGNLLAQPAQNITVGLKSKKALDVPNALLQALQAERVPQNRLLLSPAAFMGSDRDEGNSLLPRP